MILCFISRLSITVLHRSDFIDLSVVSVITWQWRYCYWGVVCVNVSVCVLYVCVRVLLMSSAAVNDSIRLFLNALVTPMGHSARESAHSAEPAQTLAGHQWNTHSHSHTHTLTHTRVDGHVHTCYTPTISGVHSLIHLFVCSPHLWRVSVVDSLNNMRVADSLGESGRDHLFIKSNACYSEEGFA